MAKKKPTSSNRLKKPKLDSFNIVDMRNSSNLRRSLRKPAYQFDFSNTIDDPI